MLKCLNVKMKRGFTLIEMLVAVTIFALVIGSVTGLFISAVRSQVKVLAIQKLLNETSYTIEYMSRFLRMARKDPSGDCPPMNTNYQLVTQDHIRFQNYKGLCQEFYLGAGGRLYEDRDVFASPLPLTSDALEITSLQFNLSGEVQPPADYLQPRVTISMTIKKAGAAGPEIKIQTTISQRNLDVQR